VIPHLTVEDGQEVHTVNDGQPEEIDPDGTSEVDVDQVEEILEEIGEELEPEELSDESAESGPGDSMDSISIDLDENDLDDDDEDDRKTTSGSVDEELDLDDLESVEDDKPSPPSTSLKKALTRPPPLPSK